jgi:hypothetical protein
MFGGIEDRFSLSGFPDPPASRLGTTACNQPTNGPRTAPACGPTPLLSFLALIIEATGRGLGIRTWPDSKRRRAGPMRLRHRLRPRLPVSESSSHRVSRAVGAWRYAPPAGDSRGRRRCEAAERAFRPARVLSEPGRARVSSCPSFSITPFLSSTSWREGLNPFVFINILERRKTDIFSICVFNNLRNFRLDFNSPFFS